MSCAALSARSQNCCRSGELNAETSMSFCTESTLPRLAVIAMAASEKKSFAISSTLAGSSTSERRVKLRSSVLSRAASRLSGGEDISVQEGDQPGEHDDQRGRGEHGELGVRERGQCPVARLLRRPVFLLVGQDDRRVRIVVLRSHLLVEVTEEVVGDLLRRRVDQARADLRQLAADGGFDVVGEPGLRAFG